MRSATITVQHWTTQKGHTSQSTALAKTRATLGLSLRQTAALLQVPQRTLEYWEAHDNRPSRMAALALAALAHKTSTK